jgi:hypothetical protein
MQRITCGVLRRRTPLLLSVCVATLACCAVAQSASADRYGGASTAGCGGVASQNARHLSGSSPPPLALGDSTMLLSLGQLSQEGYDANARGCRQWSEALGILDALRGSRSLPGVVVIALGANGQTAAGDVEHALSILGPGRVLVMVTHFDPGHVPGADSALIRDERQRHPGSVAVLDWVAHSASHGEWFQPDGLHLTLQGAAAFARFLADAIPLASLPPSLHPSGCLRHPVPAAPDGRVSVLPARGTLRLPSGSNIVTLRLSNLDPLPTEAEVTLSLARGSQPIIAENCFALSPGRSEIVRLVLGKHAIDDLGLLGRLPAILRIRTQASGVKPVTSHYLLTRNA